MRISPRLALAAGLALALAAWPSPQQEPDDHAFVDEVKKDFLDKIERTIAEADWKALFEAYDYAVVKYAQKLVRPDPAKAVWIGLIEHLDRRFSALPPAALEYYRGENDGKAQAAWSRAREEGGRAAIAEVAERWFFSSITDTILDSLGNQAFEERQGAQAAHWWRRLLEHYPDSEIPRHATAAKVALALASTGNASGLDALRRWIAERKIDGDLMIAGKPAKLSAWLAGLKGGGDAARLAIPPPVVPEGRRRFDRLGPQLRNDIKRWSMEFGAPPPDDTPAPGVRWRPGLGRTLPVAATAGRDYPYFPAYTVVRDRPVVIITDGRTVTAIDPTRVTSAAPGAGIYWRWPPAPAPGTAPKRLGPDPRIVSMTSQIGATAEGELCYATLYSEKRAASDPAAGMMANDGFEGPSRIICFNAVTGRTIWDSDLEKIHASFRKLEFYDRNWAFSAPPTVSGAFLYAPVSTSPAGEAESRLLCFDRLSGELKWQTFIASVPGMQNRFGGMVQSVPLLTQVVERGGILYVQSNLGVVAAIHAITGQVFWLSTYQHRSPSPNPFNGTPGLDVVRPSDPPAIHRGRLFVLPQDQTDLMVFDTLTGDRLRWTPKVRNTLDQTVEDVSWKSVLRLIGVADDWLLTGGLSESYMINLVDRFSDKGVKITEADRAFAPHYNLSGGGRGVVRGDLMYLPCSESNGRTLVVSTVSNIYRVFSGTWKDERDQGNLLLAGKHLVVAGDKGVCVYTDTDTLKGDFVWRIEQSPPDPQAWFEYASLMRDNDLLDDASASFQKYLGLVDADPRCAAKAREVRVTLYDIFMQQGLRLLTTNRHTAVEEEKGPDGLPKPRPADPAVRARQVRQLVETWEATSRPFATARTFAPDEEARSEATRRLAETWETAATSMADPSARLRFASRAAEEYQAVIELSPRAIFRVEGGDVSQRGWVHAASRIALLAKVHGAEAVAPVSRRAAAALESARDKGPDALRAVAAAFPRSAAAGEAVDLASAASAKAGDWTRAIAGLKDLRRDHPDRWTLDHHRRLVEALEKREDWSRVRDELRAMEKAGPAAAFPSAPGMTVKDYVERALARLREAEPPARAPLGDAPRALALFEPGQPAPRSTELATIPLPILPIGVAPREFTDTHEIVIRGSSVELWSLRGGTKVWTALHPGLYVGVYLSLQETEAGVEVQEVVAESPAAKAGLRQGDILLTADGKALTLASFSGVVEAARGAIRFEGKRDGAALSVVVTPVPWPASHKPAVRAAAFTGGYRLAVVWEDVVAAFDLADGKPAWSTPCVDPLDAFTGLSAFEDHLVLHEHRRSGSQAPPEERAGPPEKPCRIVCLDDRSGELRWARSIAGPGQGEGHEIEVVSPVLPGPQIVLLNRIARGNASGLSPLYLSPLDGTDAKSPPLQINAAFDYVVDASKGLLHYVDRDTQELRSHILWTRGDAAEPVRVLDPVKLVLYGSGGFQQAALSSSSKLIALSLPPAGPAAAQKVVIFSFATGKECATIPIPDDRSLPPNRSDLVKLDEDGTCYVYTIPRNQVQGAAPGTRRGFLSAFRIVETPGMPQARVEPLWDSVAPFISGPTQNRDAFLDTTAGGVLLYAQHAIAPGERTDAALAMYYGKRDGGYLRRVFDGLSTAPETTGPDRAPVRIARNRIYVTGKAGLTVWGN